MTEPVLFTINALDKIQQPYFGIDWWGQGRLNSVNANEQTHKAAFRHWERVFTYELYYKIRKMIDEKIGKGENADYWNKVMLQGELQKKELEEMSLSELDLEQLEKEYIPDFIFHQIETSLYQELIIEVKTKPNMTFSNFKDDLFKINQFIKRYKFKEGMFIAANNEFKHIEEQIKANNAYINIDTETKQNIYIVTRKDEKDTSKYKTLKEITSS
ncbi:MULTISPECIES: hypothetical protein [Niastella]|uniref:Uncharacterized protein n=1 Tax=Niastella soli TaxID=2821487 RepID=A0ABS3Z5Z7_9BACT|nr:hypothetical protein [Niastella soli]MBO9204851.1 hypothetical protein [Niastella soli]